MRVCLRSAAIHLRRAKASSGMNRPVEHSRSAIASRLASPARCLTGFRSRHGLLAFPSLYWRRAEEEGREPPSAHRVGARPPASGVTPIGIPAPAPQSKTSNPRLSPRGAGRAVGGILAWAENPDRRASHLPTLLRIATFADADPKFTRGSSPLILNDRAAKSSDRVACPGHAEAASANSEFSGRIVVRWWCAQ